MSVHILAVHNVLNTSTAKWFAFGQNPAVAGTLEDIWSFGGRHTEIATAAELKVSSSSGSDTFNVEIEGLDADWNPQTVTQALAGQTETAVGSGVTWIRVLSMHNVSAVPAVGDVYCYLDDTVAGGIPQTQTKVQLKMPIGFERSMAARQSVPLGKRGNIIQIAGYISAAQASEGRLMYRKFGEVAEVRRIFNIYFSGERIPYIIPLECEAKSDIFFLATGNGLISAEVNGFYENA